MPLQDCHGVYFVCVKMDSKNSIMVYQVISSALG